MFLPDRAVKWQAGGVALAADQATLVVVMLAASAAQLVEKRYLSSLRC
jgi:hypothetical protein